MGYDAGIETRLSKIELSTFSKRASIRASTTTNIENFS
jgi:hypothetical protein